MSTIIVYLTISLICGAFWYTVFWYAYRPFALLVGFVAFVVALVALSFNYGASNGAHRSRID